MQVELKVNGKPVSADVPPNTLLVQLLREHLRLTGTHVGCDTAQCGACTVMADGRAIKSCNVLALQMQGADITTVEGLAQADGTLHPVQAAFKECHGLQCGFCTPGMVMSTVDLLAHHPQASARYWRLTSRAAIMRTSASMTGRLRATTMRPLVSLSNRCTMPARGTCSACASRPSKALSKVPLQLPGAGCTTSPAGLLTTSKWASSYTTSRGNCSGLKAWLCCVGRISTTTRSPALTLCAGLCATWSLTRTQPWDNNCCR